MLELGLFETIVKVQRAFNGIGVLEFATEVTGPYGSLGGQMVYTTVLGGTFLSAPVGIFLEQINLPGGTNIVDPVSSAMRSKLLVWSAEPSSDFTIDSTRFGTGRALVFLNVGKILSKLRAQQFSFTINTLDPFTVPGNTTIYNLYDPSVGNLAFGQTHPYTTGDPFSQYPPSNPLSVMSIPAAYGEQFEATRRAAVMHQRFAPTLFLDVQTTSFAFETFNTVRWRARLTTYNKNKKDFPSGVGPTDPPLLDELDSPAPLWNVNADVNRVGNALDTAGNANLPRVPYNLTFTIKKDLTCSMVRA